MIKVARAKNSYVWNKGESYAQNKVNGIKRKNIKQIISKFIIKR